MGNDIATAKILLPHNIYCNVKTALNHIPAKVTGYPFSFHPNSSNIKHLTPPQQPALLPIRPPPLVLIHEGTNHGSSFDPPPPPPPSNPKFNFQILDIPLSSSLYFYSSLSLLFLPNKDF
ncbi:hypothetical protein ACH5RR_012066 [Cinchona calisaya]|uniref:Uncharacterized protein n=1 Tax=Cinchona calisaya TaxID=153742 RepID=A0ABD3AA45_9GENT